VPLAPRTTLGVGGPAWALAEVDDVSDLTRVLDAADAAGRPVHVLGGGSNLLVADGGFPGVVVQLVDDACVFHDHGCGDIVVEAAAGASWDDLVADAVSRDFAGIACLSGIPGLAGAAPIQNIGAYGQDVSEVVTTVKAVDRTDGSVHVMGASECGFGYRDSRFKSREPGRWIVVGVQLHLHRGGSPTIRYPGLQRAVDERVPSGRPATLQDVRDAVLLVRASKSMVLSRTDPNRRSAGSFFTNPMVDDATADTAGEAAARLGFHDMPRYDAEAGSKLSAAWLIERAGFGKGWGDGPAGLSTNHCLALVNRGEATAADLLSVAATVRRGVRDTFGVTLVPEPVFLGFDGTVDQLLDGTS
jgi:UDP-N-acetylmuramate dehydrogenase